jgi:hypothetical protein
MSKSTVAELLLNLFAAIVNSPDHTHLMEHLSDETHSLFEDGVCTLYHPLRSLRSTYQLLNTGIHYFTR